MGCVYKFVQKTDSIEKVSGGSDTRYELQGTIRRVSRVSLFLDGNDREMEGSKWEENISSRFGKKIGVSRRLFTLGEGEGIESISSLSLSRHENSSRRASGGRNFSRLEHLFAASVLLLYHFLPLSVLCRERGRGGHPAVVGR